MQYKKTIIRSSPWFGGCSSLISALSSNQTLHFGIFCFPTNSSLTNKWLPFINCSSFSCSSNPSFLFLKLRVILHFTSVSSLHRKVISSDSIMLTKPKLKIRPNFACRSLLDTPCVLDNLRDKWAVGQMSRIWWCTIGQCTTEKGQSKVHNWAVHNQA